MCARTGFRAPCETEGCVNEVTCRDYPRYCRACWRAFIIDEDED